VILEAAPEAAHLDAAEVWSGKYIIASGNLYADFATNAAAEMQRLLQQRIRRSHCAQRPARQARGVRVGTRIGTTKMAHDAQWTTVTE
jgi:hypothetical protein